MACVLLVTFLLHVLQELHHGPLRSDGPPARLNACPLALFLAMNHTDTLVDVSRIVLHSCGRYQGLIQNSRSIESSRVGRASLECGTAGHRVTLRPLSGPPQRSHRRSNVIHTHQACTRLSHHGSVRPLQPRCPASTSFPFETASQTSPNCWCTRCPESCHAPVCTDFAALHDGQILLMQLLPRLLPKAPPESRRAPLQVEGTTDEV